MDMPAPAVIDPPSGLAVELARSWPRQLAALEVDSAAAFHSTTAAKKTRLSCDRCHRQKTRCAKGKGEATCQRCLKLKVLCKFSPRAARSSLKLSRTITGSDRGLRDNGLSVSESIQHTTSTHMPIDLNDRSFFLPDVASSVGDGIGEFEVTGNLSDMRYQINTTPVPKAYSDTCFPLQDSLTTTQDHPWPGIFDGPSNMSPLDTGNLAHVDSHSFNELSGDLHFSVVPCPSLTACQQSLVGKTPSSLSTITQKLARINIKVDDCASNLPFQDPTCSGGTDIARHTAQESRKSSYFVFDELFRLTTEFIDTLKAYLALGGVTNTPALSPNSEHDPLGFHISESLISFDERIQYEHPQHGGSHATPNSPQFSQFSHLDEAVISMIVSCHSRLTETYASILQKMQLCITEKLRIEPGSSWAIILPTLQVGAVALPPLRVDNASPVSSKATSSMYMVIVMMLLSQLWDQLADLTRIGANSRVRLESASKPSFTDQSWGTVLRRTNGLIKTINSTKRQLL
jgi:hypothetical protein